MLKNGILKTMVSKQSKRPIDLEWLMIFKGSKFDNIFQCFSYVFVCSPLKVSGLPRWQKIALKKMEQKRPSHPHLSKYLKLITIAWLNQKPMRIFLHRMLNSAFFSKCFNRFWLTILSGISESLLINCPPFLKNLHRYCWDWIDMWPKCSSRRSGYQCEICLVLFRGGLQFIMS